MENDSDRSYHLSLASLSHLHPITVKLFGNFLSQSALGQTLTMTWLLPHFEGLCLRFSGYSQHQIENVFVDVPWSRCAIMRETCIATHSQTRDNELFYTLGKAFFSLDDIESGSLLS